MFLSAFQFLVLLSSFSIAKAASADNGPQVQTNDQSSRAGARSGGPNSVVGHTTSGVTSTYCDTLPSVVTTTVSKKPAVVIHGANNGPVHTVIATSTFDIKGSAATKHAKAFATKLQDVKVSVAAFKKHPIDAGYAKAALDQVKEAQGEGYSFIANARRKAGTFVGSGNGDDASKKGEHECKGLYDSIGCAVGGAKHAARKVAGAADGAAGGILGGLRSVIEIGQAAIKKDDSTASEVTNAMDNAAKRVCSTGFDDLMRDFSSVSSTVEQAANQGGAEQGQGTVPMDGAVGTGSSTSNNPQHGDPGSNDQQGQGGSHGTGPGPSGGAQSSGQGQSENQPSSNQGQTGAQSPSGQGQAGQQSGNGGHAGGTSSSVEGQPSHPSGGAGTQQTGQTEGQVPGGQGQSSSNQGHPDQQTENRNQAGDSSSETQSLQGRPTSVDPPGEDSSSIHTLPPPTSSPPAGGGTSDLPPGHSQGESSSGTHNPSPTSSPPAGGGIPVPSKSQSQGEGGSSIHNPASPTPSPSPPAEGGGTTNPPAGNMPGGGGSGTHPPGLPSPPDGDGSGTHPPGLPSPPNGGGTTNPPPGNMPGGGGSGTHPPGLPSPPDGDGSGTHPPGLPSPPEGGGSGTHPPGLSSPPDGDGSGTHPPGLSSPPDGGETTNPPPGNMPGGEGDGTAGQSGQATGPSPQEQPTKTQTNERTESTTSTSTSTSTSTTTSGGSCYHPIPTQYFPSNDPEEDGSASNRKREVQLAGRFTYLADDDENTDIVSRSSEMISSGSVRSHNGSTLLIKRDPDKYRPKGAELPQARIEDPPYDRTAEYVDPAPDQGLDFVETEVIKFFIVKQSFPREGGCGAWELVKEPSKDALDNLRSPLTGKNYYEGGGKYPSINVDHVYEKSLVKRFFKYDLIGVDEEKWNRFWGAVNEESKSYRWDAGKNPRVQPQGLFYDPNGGLTKEPLEKVGWSRFQTIVNMLASNLKKGNFDFALTDNELNGFKAKLFEQGVPTVKKFKASSTLDSQIEIFKKLVLADEFMQRNDVAEKFKNTNSRMYAAYKQIDDINCPGEEKPRDNYASRYSSWMENLLKTQSESVSSGLSGKAKTIAFQLQKGHFPELKNDFESFTRAHPTSTIGFKVDKLVDWGDSALDLKIDKRAAACPSPSQSGQPPKTSGPVEGNSNSGGGPTPTNGPNVPKSTPAPQTTSCVYGSESGQSPSCACGEYGEEERAPLTGNFDDFHSSCIYPISAMPTSIFTDPKIESTNAAIASAITKHGKELASSSSVSAASSASAAASAVPTCFFGGQDKFFDNYELTNFPESKVSWMQARLQIHCWYAVSDFAHETCNMGVCRFKFSVLIPHDTPVGCVEEAATDVIGYGLMNDCQHPPDGAKPPF